MPRTRAGRSTANANLGGLEHLAHRIEPRVAWDDLILPDDAKRTLRHLASRVRLWARVLDEWGLRRSGRRGEGIAGLFAGPSGTGKTMAAEVIARTVDPVPYTGAATAEARLADVAGVREGAYSVLASGWVNVKDLLGDEPARMAFEPRLAELRDRLGDGGVRRGQGGLRGGPALSGRRTVVPQR